MPANPGVPKELEGREMDLPKVAGSSPVAVDVEAGKTYAWCSCGLSEKQPFCDGKHRGTGMTPQKFEAKESKTCYFCMCKMTGKAPLCDGAHKQLGDD